MNTLEGAVRGLEDELHRRSADGAEYATLAARIALPVEVVVELASRGGDRALGPRRERNRRIRRPTTVETFEERGSRLAETRHRTYKAPWLATEVSTRLDKAVDSPVQNSPRECPVCLRHFGGGRADRITCSDHCRDISRRVRQNDPTVEAATKMLFAPPQCAGCGEPLWSMRPDAKHHDQACVKRARRANQREH